MKTFKRGDGARGFGGRKFSGQSGRGGYGDKRRSFGGREAAQMHKATCASCGKATEVPFRPTGEKPVYCQSCFRSAGGARPRENRSGYGERPQYDRSRSAAAGGDSRIERQIESLHEKLDRILMEIEELQDKLG